MSSFLRPSVFTPFGEIIAAQSTRLGGVSTAPYTSLNLGLHTPDAAGKVMENRHIFFAKLGISEAETVGSHQVHSDRILSVEAPGQYEGYDALISQLPGLFLTVTVADCTPVLVYDPVQRAVAAIHAGWKGTVAGIVSKTIAEMETQYGTQPDDCYAWVGTCIDECSYEVDADVADNFTDDFKRWDEKRAKFFINLKKANRTQLLQAGIRPTRLEVSPFSTYTHNSLFFSHRKEKGKAGRMLALIGLRK